MDQAERELAALRVKILTLMADFNWLATHERGRRRAALYNQGKRLMDEALGVVNTVEVEIELQEAAHGHRNQMARGSE